MRSEIVQRILDSTPNHTHIFVRKYSDIVQTVYTIIEAKYTKEQLENLDKESEVYKWYIQEYDIDLRSLSKLEDELDTEIITINLHKNSSLREYYYTVEKEVTGNSQDGYDYNGLKTVTVYEIKNNKPVEIFQDYIDYEIDTEEFIKSDVIKRDCQLTIL